MPSLNVVYASTSGHTEYVVSQVAAQLKESAPQLWVETHRAEMVKSEDLLNGDMLVLASGTWNTGSIEGQLNPHMHALLKDKAKDIDLSGKKVALIALGDQRYHFTAAALNHLEEFVRSHNGMLIEPSLRIVNEPYGQEDEMKDWAKQLSQTAL
jgi:flavodoxin I